jgi:hypothetical protein
MDVAKVNLRCYICCNNNIRMLQAYIFKCFRYFRRKFQTFYLGVAYTCMLQAYIFKCFRCFRHKFQVFYLDVAKVDLGVAYTCMLQEYVSSVSDVSYVCCKCFIWMFHMFCDGYQVFYKCFICMLQVF